MRQTELDFWRVVWNNGEPLRCLEIREACNRVGNYKQNWYYLNKRCGSWYDYGTSLDTGWITEKGKSALKVLFGEGETKG